MRRPYRVSGSFGPAQVTHMIFVILVIVHRTRNRRRRFEAWKILASKAFGRFLSSHDTDHPPRRLTPGLAARGVQPRWHLRLQSAALRFGDLRKLVVEQPK